MYTLHDMFSFPSMDETGGLKRGRGNFINYDIGPAEGDLVPTVIIKHPDPNTVYVADHANHHTRKSESEHHC